MHHVLYDIWGHWFSRGNQPSIVQLTTVRPSSDNDGKPFSSTKQISRRRSLFVGSFVTYSTCRAVLVLRVGLDDATHILLTLWIVW